MESNCSPYILRILKTKETVHTLKAWVLPDLPVHEVSGKGSQADPRPAPAASPGNLWTMNILKLSPYFLTQKHWDL